MDAQSLEWCIGVPGRPEARIAHHGPPPRATAGGPGSTASAAVDRRLQLFAYTAVSIVAGLAALAWTTHSVPILPMIDPGLDGSALAGPSGGTMLWIAFGFIGSLRVLPAPGGVTVWTFHFPFIAAAMVLGGPTAGAWVGFLSTLERRELDSQPWYGALANHSVIAFAAVVGGLTVMALKGMLVVLLGDPGLAGLLSTAVGTLVLAVVTNGIAAGTVILREGLSATGLVELLVRAFGRMTVAEIGVAWVFTFAYLAVGWWAPLALAILVLAVWPREEDAEGVDPLTKLPRLRSFQRSLDGIVGRTRRRIAPGGVLVAIDLDKFGPINKDPKLGFAVGNEALAEIGRRLREQVRATDIAARPGGDEFGAFFAGSFDRETATRLAERVETSIRRPILTSAGVVEVGASIGVVIVAPGGHLASTDTLLRQADLAMQAVKRDGGGVRLHEPEDTGREPDPGPRLGQEEGSRVDRGTSDSPIAGRLMLGAMIVAGSAFIFAFVAWGLRLAS